MGIFRRTADIFAANLNDLVDRFEEPERMLRHAVREMEELLTVTSSAVARSIATEKLLAKSSAEHATQAGEWQLRAADAIDQGDEALARRALARKMEYERAGAVVNRQLADAHDANETLRRQLDLLRDKHATTRTRLMMLSAQQTAAEAQRQIMTVSRAPYGQARALARFERFYEQVEFAQAAAAALIELETSGDIALESHFDRRLSERAIDDELTQLKGSRAADQ